MNEINDIINQIDEEVVGKFLQNSETKVSFSKDYEKHEYDYEWLSVMEEVMPYLFNIVKAPKKFNYSCAIHISQKQMIIIRDSSKLFKMSFRINYLFSISKQMIHSPIICII